MTNFNTNNLQQGDNYELLHIDIESLAINAENRSFIVLSCQDLQTAIEVNSYEASMLAFVMKEYHKNNPISELTRQKHKEKSKGSNNGSICQNNTQQ